MKNFKTRSVSHNHTGWLWLVILGDFNARSRSWWCEDITSYEGTQRKSLTISCGFHQLISDPIRLLPNSSSWIYLTFTDQPNLADSSVHPSLHRNCHHQTTFSRYNLTVKYPSPYERLVWDYNKANTKSIKQALMQVNWQNLFLNKDVHQQVRTLNDTIINFFSNFVSNQIVTFDERDPPWMTEYIKTKIQQRDNFYKNYLRSCRNNHDFQCLQSVIDDASNTIWSSKTFWSILKTFVNGKKYL